MKQKNTRSNGNKFARSTQRRAVQVAGKQYPFVKGAIQMTLADAESLSLADFPEGSLVEFDQYGNFVNAKAIQKITKQSAEVVLFIYPTPSHPILLKDKLFFKLAKGLVVWREKNTKDISFLSEPQSENEFALAVIVPSKGGTVGEVVSAARRLLSETLVELESLESEIEGRLRDMWNRGIISATRE
ncbi:MAG: hypothetical protein Q8P51_16275 [Ignavibacteria bacterium]|nr:hypothetical protein [Ignavibacteria bacterium]